MKPSVPRTFNQGDTEIWNTDIQFPRRERSIFFFVSICEAICRCPPAYIHLQLVERSCQLAKKFRFVLIKKLYRYNALNNFSRSFSEDLRSLRKVIRSEESIEQIATKK